MIEYLFDDALALHSRGDLPAARVAYQSILQRQPRDINALNLLGVLCCQQGDHEEGIRHLRKCLRLRPDFASAHNNLGHALAELGRYQEACQSLKRAVALDPNYAEGHFNLSGVLLKQEDLSGALAQAVKALEINPAHAGARLAKGMAQHALRQYDLALSSYQEYMSFVGGQCAQGYYQIGRLHHDCGNYPAALDAYRASLAMDPSQAQHNYDCGMLLRDMDREAEAVAYFHAAVELKADYAEAWSSLGWCFEYLGGYQASGEAHQKALALAPKQWTVQCNYAVFLQSLGRFAEAEQAYLAARKSNPRNPSLISPVLFNYNYSASYSAEFLKEQADAYGALVSSLATEPYSKWDVERSVDKRLKVGFVSGDFCQHPVGYFLETVLAAIDKNRLELVAYDTQPRPDRLTERLKPHFSQWHSLARIDDKAAASLIHADRIDILIDLAGHSGGNRLPVFAWKPAPVQMTWLGYFATTGVSQIDYVLTDPQVFLPGTEAKFVERPYFLPNSYFCFSVPDQQVDVSPCPALKNGFVTFGCFSNLAKVNDAVLDLWARVLNALPDSRLFLKAKQLVDGAERSRLVEALSSRGVAKSRLRFEDRTNRREYFERYAEVDIMLDTFPFPGGTTTAESLWMGVPVLTLGGDTPLGRQGVSILTAAGMSAWVATTQDEYVAKAISFAQNPSDLGKLREGLREQVHRSPLMDADSFARSLMVAWQKVWNEWVSSVG